MERSYQEDSIMRKIIHICDVCGKDFPKHFSGNDERILKEITLYPDKRTKKGSEVIISKELCISCFKKAQDELDSFLENNIYFNSRGVKQ